LGITLGLLAILSHLNVLGHNASSFNSYTWTSCRSSIDGRHTWKLECILDVVVNWSRMRVLVGGIIVCSNMLRHCNRAIIYKLVIHCNLTLSIKLSQLLLVSNLLLLVHLVRNLLSWSKRLVDLLARKALKLLRLLNLLLLLLKYALLLLEKLLLLNYCVRYLLRLLLDKRLLWLR
jgi:hypothetical protein